MGLRRALCVMALLGCGCDGGDGSGADAAAAQDAASSVYEVEPFEFDAAPPKPAIDDSGKPAEPDDASPQANPDGSADAGSKRPMRGELDSGVFIVDDFRTNLPSVQRDDIGAENLVITSAFFQMTTASLVTVWVYGEIENRGLEQRCILLIDATIDGYDIAVVADTQPYSDEATSVSTTCLRSGERGAFRAVQNDVPADLLDDSPRFTYAITGLVRNYGPDTASPALVRSERVQKPIGYSVAGTLHATESIWNCGVRFYARNDSGLLVSDAPAFPRNLDTITSGAIVDFESGSFATSGFTDEPAGLLHFNTYIRGTNPDTTSSTVFATRPPGPDDARLQRAHAASVAYDRVRAAAVVP